MIKENFGAGAARAGIAHHPEIIFFTASGNTRLWDANVFAPNFSGFVVFFVYAYPEFIGRQFETIKQQFPGKLDSFALEIVPERKITQHFEKRMMSRRVANIIQIVMLAAGTHATLGAGGTHEIALIKTEKDIFELHHTGVGK